MSVEIQCNVNGQKTILRGDKDEPLLFVLRNRLGLRGAHFGCGLEQCGACMASVNGEARYTCALDISILADAEIVTPEGLEHDPVGRALLAAFAAEHAGQCGYCLAGILMSAFALLKAEPSASRARIVEVLDRHLCRCGAHPAIMRAVERAAVSLREGVA